MSILDTATSWDKRKQEIIKKIIIRLSRGFSEFSTREDLDLRIDKLSKHNFLN